MTLPFPEFRNPAGVAEHVHDLEMILVGGAQVRVRLETRQDATGTWRGRMRFAPHASLVTFATGDIFRGASDADLVVAGRSLREHHLRDLYRSLQETGA
jgi:hypothetical protein